MEDFNPQTIEGVRNIQKTLILLGFLDQQYITGFYGPLTTSAVMEFQKQNGISQTGYVGPLTKAKLEEKLK
ncbi:peptidoglycan-binding protein [Patescibacteria group bacterium]|nr:peptidoglycan-binding protein [Patescibacteria group bacterium]